MAEVASTIRPLERGEGSVLARATLGNLNWAVPRFTPQDVAERPEFRHYTQFLPERGDFGFVADDPAGTARGVGWALFLPVDDPGYGYLDAQTPEISLWVEEGWRRLGTGRSLLRALQREARARGIARLSLSVEPDNPARRLYLAEGFVPVPGRERDGVMVWGAVSPGEDLEERARTAYLAGREDEWERLMAQAHRSHLDAGRTEPAVRCAFWLGLTLMVRGEEARGGGWLARAGRLQAEELGEASVIVGYLQAATGFQRLTEADPEAAHEAFGRAAAMGQRYAEPDLLALGRLGCGQALAAMGRTGEALTLLDETMAEVEAGGVSTIPAGLAYCAVIAACQELFDIRRAQQWTQALDEWCAARSEAVPFSGQCLVHRAELAQLRGRWTESVLEAERACEHLSGSSAAAALGMAHYRRGELHRLRGELSRAEAAFAEVARCGRPPHPGLALVRLAQGRVDAAAAAIRRAEVRVGETPTQAELLAARVEILLAAGEVAEAAAAADELERIAAVPPGRAVHPWVAQARGAVLLAQSEPEAALEWLRSARDAWQELDAPYHVARVRALLGRALERLGDYDTGRLERDAARRAFERLGARTDLRVLDASAGAGLTPAEIRVLRRVATGRTNRQVAEELVLSEKTVARHVHNILTKCGLTNRAAATAYAYEHDLL